MMKTAFYDGITEFIFVENQPQKADVIFLPGGAYPEAALYAARLYQECYAPLVLPSGKCSIMKGYFELSPQEAEKTPYAADGCRTEWEYLSRILQHSGVPRRAILREDRATYTYENAIYSRAALDAAGITVKKAILCCQAFHARRALMYYQEQFPETEILVCPIVTRGISRTTWMRTKAGIDIVLGEVERCGGQFHEILRRYADD